MHSFSMPPRQRLAGSDDYRISPGMVKATIANFYFTLFLNRIPISKSSWEFFFTLVEVHKVNSNSIACYVLSVDITELQEFSLPWFAKIF